jgi:putative transposase
MPRPRRFFPPEYKAEVVELIRSTGKTVGQVARELDLTETAVRQWVRSAELDAGRRSDGLSTAEREELRRLRREVRELREKREILRKAAVFFAMQTDTGELLPADRRGESTPLGLPACPRAGCGTRRLRRLDLAAALSPDARRHHAGRADPRDSCPQPGHLWRPRVHAELRLGLDVRVGRKRVARLMREQGLAGVHRRRGRGLTRRDPAAVPQRIWWSAPSPHRRRTGSGSPTSPSSTPTKAGSTSPWSWMPSRGGSWAGPWLPTCAPNWSWTPWTWPSPSANPAPGLVYHSDHGCQYTSLAFGRRLRETGLVASMGTVGDALDNAVAESFFATLECELLDRNHWSTRAGLRTAVFDFTEVFYNRQRRHSTLAYATPTSYEQQHASSAPAA